MQRAFWASLGAVATLGTTGVSATELSSAFGLGDPWSPQALARIDAMPPAGSPANAPSNGCMPGATLCSRLIGVSPSASGLPLGTLNLTSTISLEAEKLGNGYTALKPTLKIGKNARLSIRPKQRMLLWRLDF